MPYGDSKGNLHSTRAAAELASAQFETAKKAAEAAKYSAELVKLEEARNKMISENEARRRIEERERTALEDRRTSDALWELQRTRREAKEAEDKKAERATNAFYEQVAKRSHRAKIHEMTKRITPRERLEFLVNRRNDQISTTLRYALQKTVCEKYRSLIQAVNERLGIAEKALPGLLDNVKGDGLLRRLGWSILVWIASPFIVFRLLGEALGGYTFLVFLPAYLVYLNVTLWKKSKARLSLLDGPVVAHRQLIESMYAEIAGLKKCQDHELASPQNTAKGLTESSSLVDLFWTEIDAQQADLPPHLKISRADFSANEIDEVLSTLFANWVKS